MLKLASLLPVGDPTTGLATGRVAKVVVDEPQWTGRVDHNRPAGDRLTLRYFRDHYAPALTADPENPYLTGNGSIRFRVQNASTTYTKVYSPRRLGVFGFTVNRSHNTEIYDYPGPANNNPAALGIQGFPSGSFFLRSPFVAVGYQGPYTILASNNFQGRGAVWRHLHRRRPRQDRLEHDPARFCTPTIREATSTATAGTKSYWRAMTARSTVTERRARQAGAGR